MKKAGKHVRSKRPNGTTKVMRKLPARTQQERMRKVLAKSLLAHRKR